MTIRAAIFDAYGTLLDVHAAMQRHAVAARAGLAGDQPGMAHEADRI